MPAHARRSVTDIYIYTHRESLVRNHEPRAKALGNYVMRPFAGGESVNESSACGKILA